MNKNKLYTLSTIACFSSLLYLLVVVFYKKYFFSVCVTKRIWGIPCPSCGSTRSVLAIVNGNIPDAFYYNPLGFLFFVGILVLPIWLVFDLITKKQSLYITYSHLENYLKRNIILSWLLAGSILANWIWNFYKY